MRNYPRLAADPGRIVVNPDVSLGELKLALFQVPAELSGEATVALAASASGAGWKRQYVEIEHAGRVQTVLTPRRKSILGRAATAIDTEADATLDIELHDAQQWLTSCSDQELDLGENLAALGSEAIQFGEATPLGGGRFRLARLRRAGAGTAMARHEKREAFVLIDRSALQPVNLPARVPGSPIRAVAPGGAECSLILRC